MNVVGNFHNYGQYTDDASFEVIPSWHNKLQAVAYEDHLYTRTSHYSYEVMDNKIRLYPIPDAVQEKTFWVRFSIKVGPFEDDGNNEDGLNGVNNMSNLPFQFKFAEAGVGMNVDREDLDKLEQSMYDCWNITTDIKNILRVSDNTEEDMKALATVYETKFKILEKNLDDVDTNLVNLRETWQEMRPTHPDAMKEYWDDEEQLEMFRKEEENYYMGESGC